MLFCYSMHTDRRGSKNHLGSNENDPDSDDVRRNSMFGRALRRSFFEEARPLYQSQVSATLHTFIPSIAASRSHDAGLLYRLSSATSLLEPHGQLVSMSGSAASGGAPAQQPPASSEDRGSLFAFLFEPSRVPCFRKACLSGMTAGAIGWGVQYYRFRSPTRASDLAVAMFMIVAPVQWLVCRSTFRNTRDEMKKVMELQSLSPEMRDQVKAALAKEAAAKGLPPPAVAGMPAGLSNQQQPGGSATNTTSTCPVPGDVAAADRKLPRSS